MRREFDTMPQGKIPRGGTELDPVMNEALELIDRRAERNGRVPVVVILTDGQVGNEAAVFKRIQKEGGDTRKVEVCDTCKGYLKAQATVRALEPWAVLLEDLKTLPLDVAAVERGYQRPERPGYALEARLTARPRRFWTIPLALWASRA